LAVDLLIMRARMKTTRLTCLAATIALLTAARTLGTTVGQRNLLRACG
jgi:hypothetical protein